MKILHLPTNVANQAHYLTRGLRRLGHEAEVWQYGESRFGFPADRTIEVADKDAQRLWDAFREAVERFDVFHFHYGRSFFPSGWGGVPFFWDVPVLRMLGKRIYVSFHGSDCRLRSVHEAINPWAGRLFERVAPDDARTEKTIAVWRAYADALVVHAPELLAYVPGAQLVHRVIDLEDWTEQPYPANDPPLCVHSPSRRDTKGTSIIVEGMEALQREGVPVRFEIVEDVSHRDVQRAMSRADVVIDQILIGDHGVTAMEAMAIGRVAVAYLLPRVERIYSDSPIYNVAPDTFVDRMRTLLTDGRMRRSHAARGRAFVEEHFDPLSSARELAALYERPTRPAVARPFPGWVAFGDDRKMEQFAEKVATLQEGVARHRAREAELAAELRGAREELVRQRESDPGRVVRRALRTLRSGRRN